MKVVYLAAPYGHPDPEVIEQRMSLVYAKLAALISQGVVAVTPLTNHPLTKGPGLPGDWLYWRTYSETLLARCDLMIVYQLPGWEVSGGVRGEIDFCALNGIPVEYHEVSP